MAKPKGTKPGKRTVTQEEPTNHVHNDKQEGPIGCPTPGKECPIRKRVEPDEEGVQLICTNDNCPYNNIPLHKSCFDALEDRLVILLSQKGSARGWTDSIRRWNLWQKKGQEKIGMFCKCICGKGSVHPPEEIVKEERAVATSASLEGDRKRPKPKRTDLPTISVVGNVKQARIQARLEREELEKDGRDTPIPHGHYNGGRYNGGHGGHGQMRKEGNYKEREFRSRTVSSTSFSSQSVTSNTSSRPPRIFGDRGHNSRSFRPQRATVEAKKEKDNKPPAYYCPIPSADANPVTGGTTYAATAAKISPPPTPDKDETNLLPADPPEKQTVSYAAKIKRTDSPIEGRQEGVQTILPVTPVRSTATVFDTPPHTSPESTQEGVRSRPESLVDEIHPEDQCVHESCLGDWGAVYSSTSLATHTVQSMTEIYTVDMETLPEWNMWTNQDLDLWMFLPSQLFSHKL